MFSASVTWSAWSTWGSCETQYGCGKGKQKRSRVLVANHCWRNKSEETRPCKLKTCPGIFDMNFDMTVIPLLIFIRYKLLQVN